MHDPVVLAQLALCVAFLQLLMMLWDRFDR